MSHERYGEIFRCGPKKDKYDVVVILGKNIPSFEDIKQRMKDCQGLSCCIIGNGTKDSFVTMSYIEFNLEGKLNENSKVIVFAHGNTTRLAKGRYSEHTLLLEHDEAGELITAELIHYLNEVFHHNGDNPDAKLSLDIFSCCAGAVQAHEVPDDVRLTLHSGAKYTSLTDMNTETINNFITGRKYKGTKFNAYESFIGSFLISPETAIYCEGGKSFKATAPKHALHNGLERYLAGTVAQFLDFMETELHLDVAELRPKLADIEVPMEFLERYKSNAVLMEFCREENANAAQYIGNYFAMGTNPDLAIYTFWLACRNNRFDVVKAFLEADVDVSLTGVKGENALDIAIKNENYEIVRAICLSRKCDINRPRKEGGPTLLVQACIDDDTELATALLTSPYVDVNYRATNGKSGSAIEEAFKKRNHALVEAIAVRPETEVNEPINSTIGKLPMLFASCMLKDERMVRALLASPDINPNAMAFGLTPLHYACIRNNPELVSLLLNCKNIDVTILSEDNKKALDIATALGNTECYLLLESHMKIRFGIHGFALMQRASREGGMGKNGIC